MRKKKLRKHFIDNYEFNNNHKPFSAIPCNEIIACLSLDFIIIKSCLAKRVNEENTSLLIIGWLLYPSVRLKLFNVQNSYIFLKLKKTANFVLVSTFQVQNFTWRQIKDNDKRSCCAKRTPSKRGNFSSINFFWTRH